MHLKKILAKFVALFPYGAYLVSAISVYVFFNLSLACVYIMQPVYDLRVRLPRILELPNLTTAQRKTK